MCIVLPFVWLFGLGCRGKRGAGFDGYSRRATPYPPATKVV
jgi:hypothetical protein